MGQTTTYNGTLPEGIGTPNFLPDISLIIDNDDEHNTKKPDLDQVKGLRRVEGWKLNCVIERKEESGLTGSI